MCVMTGIAARWAGIDPMDPFGANAKNERQQEREDRSDTWAREDQIRNETFQHEQDLANRTALQTPGRDPEKASGGQRYDNRIGNTDRAY